jgi:hypothetical protein
MTQLIHQPPNHDVTPNHSAYAHLNKAEQDYLRSLVSPFLNRGARLPDIYQTPSQFKCVHGNVNVTTNVLGFARVFLQPHSGKITVYNGAAHDQTAANLGAATILLVDDATIVASAASRVISAGLKIRSLSSFNLEAGSIQSYTSTLSFGLDYDVYRDYPHQKVYSKGQIGSVRYLPISDQELEFQAYTMPFSGNRSIGFLIKGAVSLTYDLEYVINFEYGGSANTELVPYQSGPVGDWRKVVQMLSHNNQGSDAWTIRAHPLNSKQSKFLSGPGSSIPAAGNQTLFAGRSLLNPMYGVSNSPAANISIPKRVKTLNTIVDPDQSNSQNHTLGQLGVIAPLVIAGFYASTTPQEQYSQPGLEQIFDTAPNVPSSNDVDFQTSLEAQPELQPLLDATLQTDEQFASFPRPNRSVNPFEDHTAFGFVQTNAIQKPNSNHILAHGDDGGGIGTYDLTIKPEVTTEPYAPTIEAPQLTSDVAMIDAAIISDSLLSG